MNLTALTAAVQRSLPADAANSITDYLNWAVDDFNGRMRWPHLEVSPSAIALVAAQKTYVLQGANSLVPDYAGMIDVAVEATASGLKDPLLYCAPQNFDRFAYKPATGMPAFYTVVGGTAPNTLASYQTALGVTNADLIYTAVSAGGTSISLTYVVAGTGTALSIGVVGTAITVNVATNGGGVATSTASQVKAAIEASGAAAALVTVITAAGNSGAGVVTAMALINLGAGSPSILSGATQNLLVWPTPVASAGNGVNLYIRYYRSTAGTHMVTGTDVPITPTEYDQIIIQLATAIGLLAFDQEQQAQIVSAKAEQMIGAARLQAIAQRGGDANTFEIAPKVQHVVGDPRDQNPAGGSAQTS